LFIIRKGNCEGGEKSVRRRIQIVGIEKRICDGTVGESRRKA
jgi:hypothetical protein